MGFPLGVDGHVSSGRPSRGAIALPVTMGCGLSSFGDGFRRGTLGGQQRRRPWRACPVGS
ncbi:Hypothetical protein AA314_08429 [Archangium gephyra]|uniref:Uncharacterized protein n=1 Tax=Archangium gephyra TaxID=48 RepID=A0AAC8QG27_9BACT|nr:Hypothetical protein AA314_08429 [Archangium gephyra]